MASWLKKGMDLFFARWGNRTWRRVVTLPGLGGINQCKCIVILRNFHHDIDDDDDDDDDDDADADADHDDDALHCLGW